VPEESPVKLTGVIAIPLTVVHVEDDDGFHWRLYLKAPDTAGQLTAALVLVMLEEAKPVGVPQLPLKEAVPVVVKDARALYELVPPAEQTV
jgi:hypothetical protein